MSEMSLNPRSRRGATGQLAFGLVLLAVGALLLTDNLGFRLPLRLWEAWPLVVVALGAIKLLWPGDADERRSGFWILVGGLYCWISSWRLFGLHWGTAWPIFLVAQGLLIVFDGFSCRGAAKVEADDAR